MEFKEILVGVNEEEFKLIPPLYAENMLYYGASCLTDQYFIKHPVLFKDGKVYSSGEHVLFVFGHVNEGDFLTTCPIKGCAFKTNFPEIAFAQTISESVKPFDRNEDEVERVYAKFL